MANEKILKEIEARSAARREEIRSRADTAVVSGKTYYVSADGNDENDGTSPATAWRTLSRVNEAELAPGGCVLFRRGDVFRGQLRACAGVTYAAFGEGKKPCIFGWEENLADPALWEAFDGDLHIWKYKKPILDVGTLVFNEGEVCPRTRGL